MITNENQHCALMDTMRKYNEIQNEVSEKAFIADEFRKYHVQQLCYYGLKEQYKGFSSQLLLTAIHNVSASYRISKHKSRPNGFKKTSAVVYDDRVISFGEDYVSIWTTDGRLKNIPIKVYDKELFSFRKGQVDLKYENKQWFLMVTVDVTDKEKIVSTRCIGVDLGVKQIAASSDGESYSGNTIETKRKQYSEHRRRLQKRGTRSANRRIKTIGRKESRFRKNVNHQISKRLIEKAKGTNCALALEELKGINTRVTVRKSQRNQRLSWSFFQLRSFIEYKALAEGVQIVIVPALYTSQTCSACGHCEKKNRKNQSEFICLGCGFAANADYNASLNIKTLGDQSISLLLPS